MTETFLACVVFGFGAAVAALGFLWYRSSILGHLEPFGSAPALPIAQAAGGVAAITGTVVGILTMPDPRTGKESVLFKFWVMEQTRDQVQRRARWTTIERQEHLGPFLVDDDSGRALVRLHWSDVAITTRADAAEAPELLLPSVGTQRQGGFGLAEGATVLVAGTGHAPADDDEEAHRHGATLVFDRTEVPLDEPAQRELLVTDRSLEDHREELAGVRTTWGVAAVIAALLSALLFGVAAWSLLGGGGAAPPPRSSTMAP